MDRSRRSRALSDLRVELLQDVECADTVLQHLYTTRVLTGKQHEEIAKLAASASREEQARRLLDIVSAGGEVAWTGFLVALRKSTSDKHHQLADKLEEKVLGVDMSTPRQPGAAQLSSGMMRNDDEEESSRRGPMHATEDSYRYSSGMRSVGSPGQAAGHRFPPIPSLTRPTGVDHMTTSAYLPGSGYEYQGLSPVSAHAGGHAYMSMPVTESPARPHHARHGLQQPRHVQQRQPSPRDFLPAVHHAPVSYYSTGIDFRSLNDHELEQMSELLYARIGADFSKLVNALLCTIPKFRYGAQSFLAAYQRDKGLQGDMFALLQLWLSESVQPCTGLLFYNALQDVGAGIATQCRELLNV